MFLTFVRLQFLKSIRSVSITRNLIGSVFVGMFVLLIIIYVLGLAFSMKLVIDKVFGSQDPVAFLNANLLNFFVIEFMYRFFLQKVPSFELAGFLHLPIKRATIVNYLLIRSVLTPFSLIVLILFTPFTLSELVPEYGKIGAYSWLFTVVFISWILHWFVLWFKTRFGDNMVSVLLLFTFGIVNSVFSYYDWFTPGSLLIPFFDQALVSAWVPLLVISSSLFFYYLLFTFYYNNAYVEVLVKRSKGSYVNGSIGFLSRFGIIGEMADVEWKLILRHKKSRSYLAISVLFLFYGVLFYGDSGLGSAQNSMEFMYVFVGTFITGVFMIQYGQLFLSWNSGTFDFYMSRPDGLSALIRGKYLLFVLISFVCLLLTVPYVFYGVDILIAHMALFLFNIGITIHLVVNLALWKPKPMNLNKGSFFNYEGIGLAQYLMVIPLVVVPYAIYIPFVYYFDHLIGLVALGVVGVAGIIFNEKLTQLAIDRLKRDKYFVSSSFRQEL
jgi:hypothetical protein